jgi:hypothetical protein
MLALLAGLRGLQKPLPTRVIRAFQPANGIKASGIAGPRPRAR